MWLKLPDSENRTTHRLIGDQSLKSVKLYWDRIFFSCHMDYHTVYADIDFCTTQIYHCTQSITFMEEAENPSKE